MTSIYTLADRFRAQLRNREADVMADLSRAYLRVERAASRRTEGILARIEAAHARGEQIPISWLWEQARMDALRSEVRRQLKTFSVTAQPVIEHHRDHAARAASDQVLQLLTEALPGRLPAALVPLRQEVVTQIAAHTAAGSPLRSLLAEVGAEGEERVVSALVEGVSMGQHPTVIARRIQSALDGNRARALTIARTEALRAHREVSHLAMRANADVVAGWIWWSSLDRTACASCWAMHGSWHSLEERLDEHPSGRCVPVPDVRAMPGAPAAPLPRSGPDEFAGLPEDARRAILGPGKHEAMREGRISLPDLVGRRGHPHGRWGTTRSEASLQDALAHHSRRRVAAPRFARQPDRLPPPSIEHAVRKLEAYALNETHSVGKHKARVWKAALGFSAHDAHLVARLLARAAKNAEVSPEGTPEGWLKYKTALTLQGVAGQVAIVRAVWQSEGPTAPLRLITAYPEKISPPDDGGPR